MKDKTVFDRHGCNDRRMFVQGWRSLWLWWLWWSWNRRPRWDARQGREKKFGALESGRREFVRPQKQALYSPKFLGYLFMKS